MLELNSDFVDLIYKEVVCYAMLCYIGSLGVDDSSTNRLGSSVGRVSRMYGVVPGSIPGLAFSFSSYRLIVIVVVSTRRGQNVCTLTATDRGTVSSLDELRRSQQNSARLAKEGRSN